MECVAHRCAGRRETSRSAGLAAANGVIVFPRATGEILASIPCKPMRPYPVFNCQSLLIGLDLTALSRRVSSAACFEHLLSSSLSLWERRTRSASEDRETCYAEWTKVKTGKHGIGHWNEQTCEEENPSPSSSPFWEGRGEMREAFSVDAWF